MTTKPRLFVWGTCDLHDCVNIDIIRKNFEIDVRRDEPQSLDLCTDYGSRKDWFVPSLISLYSDTNEIAAAVYESLATAKTPLDSQHFNIYNEIVKFPYLEYFKNNVTENDYLILSFSSELYTKIFTKKNKFTLLPLMTITRQPSDILHWVFKDLISKAAYQMPFDDQQSLNLTYEILKDFARDLHAIFKDRIIIVKTHLTNLAYSKDTSTVHKVFISCDSHIPFYSTSRLALHNNDHSYAEKWSELIIKQFKRFYPDDIPVVRSHTPVFLDLNHKWGASPFHLHTNSSYQIGLILYDTLNKLTNDKSRKN